jgi:hypothetical protein
MFKFPDLGPHGFQRRGADCGREAAKHSFALRSPYRPWPEPSARPRGRAHWAVLRLGSLASIIPREPVDIGTGDAQIGQFPVGQMAEFSEIGVKTPPVSVGLHQSRKKHGMGSLERWLDFAARSGLVCCVFQIRV